MSHTTCTTNQLHCENCGSTDHEDLLGDQGYTACCNELTATAASCRGHHNSDDADLDAEAFEMYRSLRQPDIRYRVVADRYFDGNFTAAIAAIDRHTAR